MLSCTVVSIYLKLLKAYTANRLWWAVRRLCCSVRKASERPRGLGTWPPCKTPRRQGSSCVEHTNSRPIGLHALVSYYTSHNAASLHDVLLSAILPSSSSQSVCSLSTSTSVTALIYAKWLGAFRLSVQNARLLFPQIHIHAKRRLCHCKLLLHLYDTIQYSFITVADRPLRKWHINVQ